MELDQVAEITKPEVYASAGTPQPVPIHPLLLYKDKPDDACLVVSKQQARAAVCLHGETYHSSPQFLKSR